MLNVNSELGLTFRYTRDARCARHPGVPLRAVTAYLMRKGEPPTPVASAEAKCSPSDPFVLEEGRTLAVKRLASTLERPLAGAVLATYFGRGKQQ